MSAFQPPAMAMDFSYSREQYMQQHNIQLIQSNRPPKRIKPSSYRAMSAPAEGRLGKAKAFIEKDIAEHKVGLVCILRGRRLLVRALPKSRYLWTNSGDFVLRIIFLRFSLLFSGCRLCEELVSEATRLMRTMIWIPSVALDPCWNLSQTMTTDNISFLFFQKSRL